MVVATIKSIEDVCIHPVSGKFFTPVGCNFIVGLGIFVTATVGFAMPPVSRIGMSVGETDVLLYARRGCNVGDTGGAVGSGMSVGARAMSVGAVVGIFVGATVGAFVGVGVSVGARANRVGLAVGACAVVGETEVGNVGSGVTSDPKSFARFISVL